MDLVKRDTTRLIEHGERWVSRVKHLREMGYNPEQFLFPLALPGEVRKAKHANEIQRQLTELKVWVVKAGERDRICAFAKG